LEKIFANIKSLKFQEPYIQGIISKEMEELQFK